MTGGREVVVGVGGGIAAYKACSLVRLFAESGDRVTVVPTAAALSFVGAATWAALSGRPAGSDPFSQVHEVPHVRIGQRADLVVVAPATADLLARAAHGLADDLLTNTLLTARCPVVMAPAMHTEMWLHPATAANVQTLRGRGVHVLEPASGRLTGADSGPGRLPEPAAIHGACLAVLGAPAGPPDLTGLRVLISAGGTREALDPVRFLGNRSSGRQGYALAEAAAARGAAVELVSANVQLPDPVGVRITRVGDARQLHAVMLAAAAAADVVVMAAAVADFRPEQAAEAKIKKTGGSGWRLDLVQNPDILRDLVAARRAGQVVVGFAAETGDGAGSVLDHGRAKLARKACDLLVVNEVGANLGFGTVDNSCVIIGPGRPDVVVPTAAKIDVAHRVLSAAAELLADRSADRVGPLQ